MVGGGSMRTLCSSAVATVARGTCCGGSCTRCSASGAPSGNATGLNVRAIVVKESTALVVAEMNGCRTSAGMCAESASWRRVLVRSVSWASMSSAGLEPGILKVLGNHARLSETRVALVVEM